MSELSAAQDIVVRLRRQANNAYQQQVVNPDVLADAADFIEVLHGAIRDHQDYKQSDRTAVVADHADLELWTVLD